MPEAGPRSASSGNVARLRALFEDPNPHVVSQHQAFQGRAHHGRTSRTDASERVSKGGNSAATPALNDSERLTRIPTAHTIRAGSGSKKPLPQKSSAPATTGSSVWRAPVLNNWNEEIRLLYIDPSSDLHSPITCSISTYSLDSLPVYYTLSYVCGSPDVTHTVHVDGSAVQVYTNLEIALRHLRFSIGKTKGFVIWVDALCIDQKNDEEKEAQILLMGSIYARCHKTVIWLGLAEEDSNGHLALLDRPSRHTLPLDEKTKSAAFSILGRPWWTRVWCHQELILAPDGFFLCGLATANISNLLHHVGKIALGLHSALANPSFGISAVAQTMDIRMFTGVVFSSFTVVSTAQIYREDRNDRKPETFKLITRNLIGMVAGFRNSQAKDPRDKVFALLNVVRGDPATIRNPPNYKMTYREVCTRLARTSIESSGAFEILHFCRNDTIFEPTIKQPSWVPTWDPIGSFPVSDPFTLYSDVDAKMYKACGNQAAECRFVSRTSGTLEDSSLMIAHGLSLGLITNVGQSVPPMIPSDFNCQSLPEGWVDAVQKHTGTSGIDVERRIWSLILRRSLCQGGNGRMIQKSVHEYLLARDSQAANFRPTRPLPDQVTVSLSYVDLIVEEFLQNPRRSWPHGIETELQISIPGSQLCITDSGYMVLTTLSALRPGDVLCILFGGHVPYILRKESGSNGQKLAVHNYICEAFVGEVMYGEAMSQYDSGKLKKCRFVIA